MFNVINGVLSAAVATSGTFTASYPTGTSRSNFVMGVQHRLVVAGIAYVAPTDFTVAFGATLITVTWLGTNTLPSGATWRLQVDQGGVNAYDAIFDTVLASARQTSMAYSVLVNLGNPAVSSATAIRAAAAVANAPTVSIVAAAGYAMDFPRNVIITSVGNDSGITFDVRGTDAYGAAMRETITGANAGVATGVKAFATITSVFASGAGAGNVSIGTGTRLGLPVHLPNSGFIFRELEDGATASAGTVVAGLSRLTKSTAITADTRGTYVPASTPDGSKTFQLILLLPDPGFRGSPQFNG